MSKTLYLLGFETKEGIDPVSTEVRKKFGFPTDPHDIARVSGTIFDNQNPQDFAKGSDLAIAAVGILRGVRCPQELVPGVIRPIYFSDEGRLVWNGFKYMFPLISRAKGIQYCPSLPDFDEIKENKADGLLVGAYADIGENKLNTLFLYSKTAESFTGIDNQELFPTNGNLAALAVFKSINFEA